MNTPVAFLIFNRPDTTSKVFDEIRRARPRRLLVVADGARNEAEAERCAETRAVIERVDWDCEVLTNFADANMGCRRRISTGLDWVFEHCEEAIILEDDCVPHPTFFPFCAELLERYRDDQRVGMICGNNFQRGQRRTPYSYYFSRHVTVWGWASWRRAWRHYDVEMRLWPQLRETSWLADMLVNPVMAKYWQETFDRTHDGEIDTWDFQLFFSWWAQNALAITPDVNLISNIGFGHDATHTRDVLGTMAELPVEAVELPLSHPPYMSLDREADEFAFRQICPWIVENQNLYWRLRHRLAGAVPEPVRKSIRQLKGAKGKG
ncbi:MAG TPA: hypothetical protein VF666_17840 [Pyrinomonadaceae bacterium]